MRRVQLNACGKWAEKVDDAWASRRQTRVANLDDRTRNNHKTLRNRAESDH